MKSSLFSKNQNSSPPKRAQAMVEFALVLPLLLVLIIGIFEFGRLFYAWLIIENSTRFGIRYATAGSYDFITYNWNIPALAAGGTATLTLTLFTMQTGLPPVYAQVSGATPGDVDSQPNNGISPVVAEDDEALVDVTSTQPCDISLSFVDVACVPASPNGPPEDYFQYRVLATRTDPTVEFIEIAQDANFIGKYIVRTNNIFDCFQCLKTSNHTTSKSQNA